MSLGWVILIIIGILAILISVAYLIIQASKPTDYDQQV